MKDTDRRHRGRALAPAGRPIARARTIAIAATAIAVLAIGSAVPAAALARDVTGGGTFAEAPLVGPGTYTDTLLPRETLFYAVKLSAGQRLTVRGTVGVGVGDREQGIPVALGGFSLDIYTPLHQALPRDSLPIPEPGDYESDGAGLVGPRVLSASTADARELTGVADWTGPGVYHVAAVISSRTAAVVEYPLRLEIAISGAGAGTPTLGPLGDPRAGPRRTPAIPAAAPGPDGGGIAPLVIAVAGLTALLVGALAGTMASAARRRRREGA